MIRDGVRPDRRGRRVLFLEEIQSDWHAALHADEVALAAGRMPMPPARAPFRKDWPLLALKVMLWWAQRLGLEGVAWSSYEVQADRWRGSEPPDLFYRTLLPEAAANLAAVLGLSLDTAAFRVRTRSRRVKDGDDGWEVLGPDRVPVTKPFANRVEAETFADLTGEFVALDLPVLWLDGLPPIQAVPLYGAGSVAVWYGPWAGTAPATAEPSPVG